MADVVFSADLDIRGVKKALNEIKGLFGGVEKSGTQSMGRMGKKNGQQIRQMGFAMQRFGIQGAAAWGEIFASAGKAGLIIGGVIVTVKVLIKLFKTLYNVASKAFSIITKMGVEAAKEYEVAGAQFKAIMKGNEQAAEATLDRVKKLSRELGQNLTGVAKAFIPEVESLDQLEQVLKIAAALGRYQPEQGEVGARIALQEFLSGETRSLRRRFEVPQDEIDKFKEAFEFGGIQAALDSLDSYLDRTGRSLEALSDTATVAWGRMKEGFRQLAATYGEPIVDAAKNQLNDLNDTVEDMRPSLEIIATIFGDVVAVLVDLAGVEAGKFIEGIDLLAVQKLGVDLMYAAESFGVLIGSMNVGDNTANVLNSTVVTLSGLVLQLGGSFIKLGKWVHDASAELRSMYQTQADVMGFYASVTTGANDFMDTLEGIPLVGDTIADMFDFTHVDDAMDLFDAMTQAQADFANGLANFTGTQEDWDKIQAEFNQTTIDYYVNLAKLYAAQQNASDAGEKEADGILSRDQAMEKLAVSISRAIELELELAEIRGKFDDKAKEKMAGIDKKFALAEIDAEIRKTRRKEDIEQGFWDKLEDLRTDYNQKMAKLGRDLRYDEEDIARKHGRKVIDIEQELAQERLDNEEKFRRRLAEIRRKFDFEAEEAIRANDAVEYLRIRRREEFELNEARIKKDEENEDAESKAAEKRKALKDNLEQELEDARIANRRKIDELNHWLEEQTAEINLWSEREREQANTRYKRDLEDAQTARSRDLDSYHDWWRKMHKETEEGAADIITELNDMRDTISQIVANFPDLTSQLFGRISSPGRGGLPIGVTLAAVPPRRGSDEIQEIQRLRSLAVRYGIRAGYDINEIQQSVRNMEIDEIREYIFTIQDELKMGGRQEGGSVRHAEPVLVGEALPGGKPNPEIFIPAQDGFVVPIKLLADKTGRTPADLIKTITEVLSTESKESKTQALVKEIGYDGRQDGGPVYAGQTVVVGEPRDGDMPNPELFIPSDPMKTIGLPMQSLEDATSALSGKMADLSGPGTDKGIPDFGIPGSGPGFGGPRRSHGKGPQLVGMSPTGAPHPHLFKPPGDGLIVPIKQLATASGRSPGKVIQIIRRVIKSGARDKTGLLGRRLGIEGRQLGGPVSKGTPVFVGEPLPGNVANPELFLPTKKHSDQSLLEELGRVGNKKQDAAAAKRSQEITTRDYKESVRRLETSQFVAGKSSGDAAPASMIGKGPGQEMPIGFAGTGEPDNTTSVFKSSQLSLQHMYYSPPFHQPFSSGAVDNSRQVHINQPELNPGLTPMEVAQVKELFSQMRIEELMA